VTKAFYVFVAVIVLSNMLGDTRTKDFINIVWLIFWGLFMVFLVVHSWMDKRGMFNPGYKKKDKEG
jgi:hypothetical protein